MTGPFSLWTVTLKGDERGPCPHFSSSNWVAVIREGSLAHPSLLLLLHPFVFDFFFFFLGEVE